MKIEIFQRHFRVFSGALGLYSVPAGSRLVKTMEVENVPDIGHKMTIDEGEQEVTEVAWAEDMKTAKVYL